METVELRPPQFSEDLAWLPCWLQQNQTTPSSEQGIKSIYESVIKEFGYGIINKLEDENLYPKDGGCNNFHLFLSGHDSIPESIAPSSNNALHFHLHLSSYGGSECTPLQPLDESHHLAEYAKVQSISMLEASLGPRENVSSRKGINTGDVDLLPQSSNKDIVDNLICQSLTNIEDHEASSIGVIKSDVRYLKYAEVNNAIGLPIVASEPLVDVDLPPQCSNKDIVDNLICQSLTNTEDHEASSIAVIKSNVRYLKNVEVNNAIELPNVAYEPLVDIDLPPQSSNKDIVDNVICQSPTNTKDHEEKSNALLKSDVRYLKNAEVNNAIELSVVASEALVIHDLLKAELDSEALSVEVVLEVSIQVKKARIELLKSAYQSLNEELDLSDSLSDLDDLIMRDAFDDVGLPCNILNSDQCKTIGFDVQDTPANENQYTHGSQCNSFDMTSQQDILDNGLSLKQFENNLFATRHDGLPLEHLSCNIQNQLSDDVVLASTSPSCCKYDDSMSQCSAQNVSDELVVKQKIASSTVPTNLCMNHAKENSSLHDCNTVPARNKERVTFLSLDRFKSRWLGGWTDVSEHLRQNVDGKTIPAMFVNETSFLSESANIAPDENSCVQRCESKYQVASQSSVPFGHLDDGKGDEGFPVTEDVVKCSLSLVDPLCSYVPCSISLDDDCAKQNLNEGKDFTKECLSTSVDIGGSRPLVRRQSASLKTYSTMPTRDSEGGKLDNNYSHQQQGNMRPSSLDSPLDCTRLSCKRIFVETLPSWPTSTSGNVDIVEDSQTDADHNLFEEITELKSKSDEVVSDGTEFLVQSKKKKIAHGIVNQSLQVSKPIMIKKSSIKKDHLQSSGTETMFDPQKVGNAMKMQNESTNPLEPCMLVKKRVRFSEANDRRQENQDLQKVQPSPKNYFALRSGKRWKFSNQCLISRHRDGESDLKSPYCKSREILIFQGIQFLITGFSSHREKDIEGLVWNNGGMVLPDVPCPSSWGKNMSKSNCKGPPVILSSKKLQTTKFLYGCAVNALIVNVRWLTDSIAAGSMLPPWKYTIISNRADCTQIGGSIRHCSQRYIFENVGIMLHGKQGFCTKLTKVLKHGDAQVFKTLQWLVKRLNKEKVSVGVIVVEDEYKVSRHLKQCALEQGIPIMSAKWVIKSLHSGELLPLTDNNNSNKSTFRETSVEL